VVLLAEVLAGRLQVHEQRDLQAQPLPVLQWQVDPMCRAIAPMWIGALVDPPIAELTTMAFSNASRVRMSDGLRSSATISTIRRPVR
jgi:hypothetical protein